MLARTFALVAVLAALAASSAARAAPVFVLTGKGWGHGIGLSQYGAYGFAQHGWGYDEILARYYKGTALAPGHPNDVVEVLLASGRSSLTVGSAAPFSVAGETLPAGSYAVTALTGRVRISGNGLTRIVASPVTIAPAAASLELGAAPYRGKLVVASSIDGKTLSVLNSLAREYYVRGVVPREMPSGWHAESLKAQAVAARSYSFAVAGHCLWPVEPAWAARFVAPAALAAEAVFCSDTRDQVYGGKSAETSATNSAVQATAGEAPAYAGGPATTYFFSTSGGKTAAKADEWGGAVVPYLVPVDDPYDAISPHHAWGPKDAEVDCAGTSPDCVFTGARVRTALGLSQSPVDLEVTARNSSGRVAELTAMGASTVTRTTGTTARTKLGLRSTWFFVGVLSLAPSASTVTYGGRTTLAGLARSGGTSGWVAAHLQRRRYGKTSWTTLGDALPNGSWSRTAKPTIATDYRVVSGNATGERRTISVRTRVLLATPKPPYTKLTGSVGPAKTGIAVTLQRKRADGTWAFVAKTSTNASGGFAFTISKRGAYRVRADAGAGYLLGSATVTVPSA